MASSPTGQPSTAQFSTAAEEPAVTGTASLRHKEEHASERRFTRDGTSELERHLAQICEKATLGISQRLPRGSVQGLLLGGGYGRGEGGVLRTPAGDRPYNDLEFYLFVRGSRFLAEPLFRRTVHHLAHELSAQAGVEVEFKFLTVGQLHRSPTSMFYYDLVTAHRPCLGPANLLTGCDHHRDATAIPLSEAARLLMNRCSGLLFSANYLRASIFGPEEADFVYRNIAKAELALGDVWLAANRQYHWSCLERQQRLEKQIDRAPDWMSPVRAHHAHGVEFKLHPVRSAASRDELAAHHHRVTELAERIWLWLESLRLGRLFASPWDYATSRVNKCPETAAWKNGLLHLRTFGPSSLVTRSAVRYPRERLLHALALLLFEPSAVSRREPLRAVQRALRTEVATFSELVQVYQRLWSRFN